MKTKIKKISEKYEKILCIEELKRNLEWKIKNRQSIDPIELKQIYKMSLLESRGVYFTPETSEEENDKNNNIETKKIPQMKFIFYATANKKFNCNCKRSQCNKNYCACKNSGEVCNDKCACEDCQNVN